MRRRVLSELVITVCLGCITTVVAYDPDIEDRSADQHIAYFIVKEIQQPLIEIDKVGCMKLKKPLDRDPPNGYSTWTVSFQLDLSSKYILRNYNFFSF